MGFEARHYIYRAYIPNQLFQFFMNFMSGTSLGIRIIYQLPNLNPEQQFKNWLCVKNP